MTETPPVACLVRDTFRHRIADELRGRILNGIIPPGAQLVESQLATRFGVSRGPLREAIRQLVQEGLVVNTAYTATHVINLSIRDVREIYSIRTALESFAFELVWNRRGPGFATELRRRHDVLLAAVDAEDTQASIGAELNFHALVYEWSEHRLLMETWCGLCGRLQLYWSALNLSHRRKGPRRGAHDAYLRAALGKDLAAIGREIAAHMQLGVAATEEYLAEQPAASEQERAS